MLHAFTLAAYIVAALVISISDVRYRIIRNRDLTVFLCSGVVFNASDYSFDNLRTLSYVSAICIALYAIFKGKIGAGDLKLFWVISFWVISLTRWLEGLTLAWILGGAFALLYLALNKRNVRRSFSIPFAPFIFLGFLAAI
jgi:Flp pilus assembly protein protease CpaA